MNDEYVVPGIGPAEDDGKPAWAKPTKKESRQAMEFFGELSAVGRPHVDKVYATNVGGYWTKPSPVQYEGSEELPEEVADAYVFGPGCDDVLLELEPYTYAMEL